MSSQENPPNSSTTVLVSGGSGFVASHLIIQLLAAGYTVHTTIRSLTKEAEVVQSLQGAGADTSRLTFFAADLTQDSGWAEAVKGCTYVHHVASPFPLGLPKTEDELIIPAREGTLRVLRAACDAGVKRVVMTSSFAAIGYGHGVHDEPFTERDWSVLDGRFPAPAYHKSKTLAEKAAWNFIETGGRQMEFVVINPPAIFGPVLGADYSTSIQLIQKLIDGSVPACPQISFGVVDVRDLADLHIRAMLNPGARNERFIGVNDDGPLWMVDIAKIIKKSGHEKTDQAPTWQLPNWLVRVIGLFDSTLGQMVPELGQVKRCSNEKAKRVLGWVPRPTEETVLNTVDSLVKHKIV